MERQTLLFWLGVVMVLALVGKGLYPPVKIQPMCVAEPIEGTNMIPAYDLSIYNSGVLIPVKYLGIKVPPGYDYVKVVPWKTGE